MFTSILHTPSFAFHPSPLILQSYRRRRSLSPSCVKYFSISKFTGLWYLNTAIYLDQHGRQVLRVHNNCWESTKYVFSIFQDFIKRIFPEGKFPLDWQNSKPTLPNYMLAHIFIKNQLSMINSYSVIQYFLKISFHWGKSSLLGQPLSQLSLTSHTTGLLRFLSIGPSCWHKRRSPLF